jgi:hypothetical protein
MGDFTIIFGVILIIGLLFLTYEIFLFISKYVTVGKKYLNKFSLAGFSSASIASTLIDTTTSTVVELTDAELHQLLQVVFDTIGNSNQISITLLESLGLATSSVISYLINLGFTIIF